MKNSMILFVDDSDDDFELASKKQKVSESESEYSSDELSDSEWEDIPFEPLKEMNSEMTMPSSSTSLTSSMPSSFSVLIRDQEDRKEKIQQYIREKKTKVAIHNLALVSYILHATHRNKMINQKEVQKVVKKLLPETLLTKVKKLKKSIKNNQKDCGVQLVYILKYIIKWFRLNYKVTCNGLRVLGYLPKSVKNKNDQYFPNNSPTIDNLKAFTKTIKQFGGNRDTGAQILTAIIRSLGLEARLVFSVPVLSPKSKILQPKLNKVRIDQKNDYDLLYPYFWTEVVNPMDDTELFIIEACTFHDEEKRLIRIPRHHKSVQGYTDLFFPKPDQFNSMTMSYVISIDSINHITDVSSRYMKDISYRYFERLDLRTEVGRSYLLFTSILRALNKQFVHTEETECLKYLGLHNYDLPSTKSAIKRNPNFTTVESLRYDEVLTSSAVPITKVTIDNKKVPIYFRNDVIVGKSEQQWKFLGRSIKPDQTSKFIKLTKSVFPRTIHRKRMYNLNIQNGTPELNAVRLYSFDQTCAYIKETVTYIDEQAILPKNKFGNIEIFNPAMVPDGCGWLQLSDIESCLASDKTISYVPVVTGFSFKKKGYAIPRKDGVLVLVEEVERAKKVWLGVKIERYREDKRQRQLRGLYTWQGVIERLRLKKRLDETYNQKGYKTLTDETPRH